MEIMKLENQQVVHKKFGKGIICSIDNAKYLNVKFEKKEEICKFVYPQCFYGYLTLEDSELELKIISVVDNWKNENNIKEKEILRNRYKETLRGIEKRRNAAEEKKIKASQRAAEHRTMYNIKKEKNNNQ